MSQVATPPPADGNVERLLDAALFSLQTHDSERGVELLRDIEAQVSDLDDVRKLEDLYLGFAEFEWTTGLKDRALGHYDKAIVSTQRRGDHAKEGMISMGKGFGLFEDANGEAVKQDPARRAKLLEAAVACLRRAMEIATDQAQEAQASFAAKMLERAQTELARTGKPGEISETVVHGIAKDAFFTSLMEKNTVVLVMNGTREVPRCAASRELVLALLRTGVQFETLDVSTDSGMADAVKAHSSAWSIPQLFVGGALFGGVEVADKYATEGDLRASLVVTASSQAPSFESQVDTALIEKLERLKFHSRRIREVIVREAEAATTRNSTRVVVAPELSGVARGNNESTSGGEGASGGEVIDPVQVLLQSCEDQATVFQTLLDRLDEIFGGEMDLRVPVTDIDSEGFPKVTVETIARFIEERCPANGDCNSCPSKSDCKVHKDDENQCDIEDILQLACTSLADDAK